MNPSSWESATEDKDVFHRFAESNGLPLPGLFGVYYRKLHGWTPSGRRPYSNEDWGRFFEEDCPDQFVVKPSRGAYGYGVRVVTRTADGFDLSSGQSVSSAHLAEAVFTPVRYQSFVIQELIRSHPRIEQLSGSASLQTVRVITVSANDASIVLLAAGLKIVIGSSPVDNPGTAEAIHSSLSTETGVIQRAVISNPSGVGFTEVDVHPITNRSIVGFQIPFHSETFALARRAAIAFQPIRSIGWDIGISTDGPVIIEANQWWGPPNDRENAVAVFREFKRLVS